MAEVSLSSNQKCHRNRKQDLEREGDKNLANMQHDDMMYVISSTNDIN